MKKKLCVLLTLCLLAASLLPAMMEEPEELILLDEGEDASVGALEEVIVLEAMDEGIPDPDPQAPAPVQYEEETGVRYARLQYDAPVYGDPDSSALLATLPGGSHVLVIRVMEAALEVAFATADGAVSGYVSTADASLLSPAESAAFVSELAVSGQVMLYGDDLDRPLPCVEPLSSGAKPGEAVDQPGEAPAGNNGPEEIELPPDDTGEYASATAAAGYDDSEEIELAPEDGNGSASAAAADDAEADAAPGESSDAAESGDPEVGAADLSGADILVLDVSEDALLDAVEPDDEALLSIPSVDETVECVIDDPVDSDELFANYSRRILYGSGRARRTMASSSAGEQLTGQDRVIYESVKSQIIQVAAGKSSSTDFDVPVSEVLGRELFTADEASALLKDGLYSWSIDLVCSYALWFDCTYELYWLDRYSGTTISASYSKQPFTKVDGSTDTYTVAGKNITLHFPVLEQYRLNGSQYEVDPASIERAKTAADNAKAIVDEYASYSDYVKLLGYAKEICDLVVYNNTAAGSGWQKDNPQVQDPWKLIWVFDGDDSTNVVCEGYSQAFQYLCELTDFNDNIRCILVTGYAGGAHSWNVVRMDDGKNYVVDVTWMDDSFSLGGLNGSMADWINDEKGRLFLCGASSGSVSDGYTIDYRVGGSRTYRTYRETDTLKVYPTSALTLAGSKYVLTGFQRIGNSTYFFDSDGHYLTGTHQLDDIWYDFDSSGRLQGMPTGWRTVNGKRYFFEADGSLHTRHTSVTDGAVAATCTAAGKTEGRHCSVCGAVLKAQEIVPATGHTSVTDEAVAATCTAAGKTEGSHCSVCGTVLKAQEIVPATGHTPVTDKAVAATCTAAGKTAGSHCSVCGTVLKAQEIVPATGHTPVTDKAVAATSKKAGLTKGSHCSVCGTVLKAQKIAPYKISMKKSVTKTVTVGVPVRIVYAGKTIKSCKLKKTSYKKLATVTGSDLVTPKKKGTVKITVTPKKGKAITLTLKIVPPEPTGIVITSGKNGKATVKKGKKLTLKTKLTPGNAESTLTWKSSNKKVATVSGKGVVKGVKKGTCTITVTTRNRKKATIKITVK